MKTSLIVPTIGREEPLAKLLASLRAQSCRDFEVILADQNPIGRLDSLLELFKDLPITRIQIEPRGVSHARNAALPFASGQVIGFPDDDCFYETDTLAELSRFFEEDSEAGGVLGQWAPPGCPFRNGMGAKPATMRSAFSKGETHVQFYRREAVERTGVFDESLGPGTGLPYGCGEDTDYLLRALKAGVKVKRCPSIRSRHPAPDLGNLDASKTRSYALGRMRLLQKHEFGLAFKLANVLFPLFMMPLEGFRSVRYRLAMAQGRFEGLVADLAGKL